MIYKSNEYELPDSLLLSERKLFIHKYIIVLIVSCISFATANSSILDAVQTAGPFFRKSYFEF
jgi:hypothetical protein